MDYLDGGVRRIEIRVQGHQLEQKVIADGYPGPDVLEIRWMA